MIATLLPETPSGLRGYLPNEVLGGAGGIVADSGGMLTRTGNVPSMTGAATRVSVVGQIGSGIWVVAGVMGMGVVVGGLAVGL